MTRGSQPKGDENQPAKEDIYEIDDGSEGMEMDPVLNVHTDSHDAFYGATSRLPLKFHDRQMESDFLQYHTQLATRHVQTAMVIGMLIYASFGILDAYMAPVARTKIWAIRFIVVCPAIAVTAVLLSFSTFLRFIQPILCGLVVISGGGIVAIIFLSYSTTGYSYYSGLILVLMFGYTFFHLRFVWAAIAGMIILLMYAFSCIWINAPPLVLLSSNFFIVGANIIGMIASYQIEFFARRDFYWAFLLKQQKHNIANINRHLETLVNDRTRQLASTNQGLEREIAAHKRAQEANLQLMQHLQNAQKLEAIGTLAGGIAHDFNNILAAILGYSELAMMRLPENHPSRDLLNQVMKASMRAKELIRQILTFSRRHQYKDPGPVDVKPVVQEVVGFLQASLPKNIEIRKQVDHEPYPVAVDMTHLHQVLMNLCMNAAQAMEPKGGLLDLVVTNDRLTEQSATLFDGIDAGEYLKITVTDTGSGINPTHKEKIFDPYFSTKDRRKGSGMGLAVTFGIVKGHGGAIRVESKVGEGSRFEVVFPRRQGRPSPIEETESLALKGNQSILFVDDEAYLTQLVDEMLTRLHYRCQTFTDPTAALEALQAAPYHYDLVITDMNMPKMSGRDLAMEVDALRPDLPVLICTGFSESMAGFKNGDRALVNGFIMKPFTIQELGQAVRSALEGAKGTGSALER